jgi:hypothetical protein
VELKFVYRVSELSEKREENDTLAAAFGFQIMVRGVCALSRAQLVKKSRRLMLMLAGGHF